MHFAAALFVLLALTQGVFCSLFSVSFSQVKQCGSFRVNFTGVPGTAPPALPVTLTIVPFNSNPILIPIPIGNWDNTTFKGTAEISFLPFDDDTQFVASLDDANGQGMGLVSDVIGVMSSPDSSCLPPSQRQNFGHGGGGNKGAKTDFYDFKGDFSQCSTFNVTFDPTEVTQPPSIRAFLPRSFSFFINATDAPSTSGNQQYMLDVFHGFQAVLLLDDGDGHAETSGLFTTGGDVGSSKDCFPFDTANQTTQVSATDTTTQTEVMSKDAKIIVAAACVVVVLLVGIIMAFVIQRKRARNRQFRSPNSSTKSFVFTEDVDMGSTFIGRVRGRLSQFLGSNFSVFGEKRSYRSFPDDEKSVLPYSYDGSYGIPTSPRGSLIPPKSRPISEEKHPSWLEVERMLEEKYYKQANRIFIPFSTSTTDSSPFDNRESRLPNPPFPLPVIDPPPAARIRDSAPDAPLPAVPRSPSTDCRYGSGFGFGSVRTSRSASDISSDQCQRTSESSFGNLNVQDLRINLDPSDSSSESSFGNELFVRVKGGSSRSVSPQSYTPSSSSLRSSQFAFALPQTRTLGERVNAARAPPFPTSPICSRRTSRTSR